ncbi:MAG: NFACT family protein [Candidatus Altarchaeum sp.]|nr:NFACT family protein [Candidatus Altarchaeum sp.]
MEPFRKTCGFDFYILCMILKDEISNGRIEKIYYVKREGGYVIKFVVHKQEKKILLITNNSAFVYVNDIIENPRMPSTYTMVLRKYLENKFISEISQCNNDKILSVKTLNHIIYLEFFGSGNVILCDNENKIIDALVKREWKGRAIKPGEIYKFPENMSDEENKKLRIFFGVYFDILPKDKLNLADGIKILENKKGEILEMFKNLIEHNRHNDSKNEKIDKDLKKLEFVAEQQRKRTEELGEEALLLIKTGDEIYKNFGIIEEILKNAKNKIPDSRIKRIEGNNLVVEI